MLITLSVLVQMGSEILEMGGGFQIMGPVPTRDMQTPPPRFDPVFMKDAEYAETNEKLIFRFLFFELS